MSMIFHFPGIFLASALRLTNCKQWKISSDATRAVFYEALRLYLIFHIIVITAKDVLNSHLPLSLRRSMENLSQH